ncbi:DUF5320 domain-containing protein [Thermosipho atlanticus]|uniref:Uncharacterized protein n=1 Tax=Thermosipho atlanticus DSM 15807 TaxID=1123380 RepID=A0A1M5QRB3_9BACT|nr:DUF5320 domain-containing protein [Thermosipho atlanticus]SHH16411.1 hypothetical protein SAMN02745199_0088 [Thermosipho atlanticus DSM 15807]
MRWNGRFRRRHNPYFYSRWNNPYFPDFYELKDERLFLENEKEMLLDYKEYLKEEMLYVERRIEEIEQMLQGGE